MRGIGDLQFALEAVEKGPWVRIVRRTRQAQAKSHPPASIGKGPAVALGRDILADQQPGLARDESGREQFLLGPQPELREAGLQAGRATQLA